MPVAPHAHPYAADGGDVGVLLSHGFTGSPASVRPWAEQLADRGLSVRVPRLTGHGTSWQEMNRTRWQDWYAAVDRAFRELRRQCQHVVVGGLSMGGGLALRLAEEHGRDVAGLVLVNPFVQIADQRLRAVPLMHHVMRSTRAIGGDIKKADVMEYAYPRVPMHALSSMLELGRVVREDLPKVTQPLLMFRSAVDHVIDPLSGRLIVQRVSSRDISEQVLDNSYHVATLDHDADTIYAESLKFVARVTSGSA